MEVGLRWGKVILWAVYGIDGGRLRNRGGFSFPQGRRRDKLAGMGRSLAGIAGLEESYGDDERMRSILRGNPLPMWICDRETKQFLEVSRGAVQEYGYTRDEFLEMTVGQLGAPDGYAQQAIPECCDEADCDLKRGWRRTICARTARRSTRRSSSNALVYNGRVARLVVARDLATRIELCAELTRVDAA